MNQIDPADRLDRRALVKVAAGGLAATGLLTATSLASTREAAAMVPDNFRALVHVTTEDSLQYAYAALETISEHYSNAKARLVIDGSAVKVLVSDGGLDNVKSVHDGGAEIAAASDALAINGIDPESLPDFIDVGSTGVIAVVDAQVKGYHYYKL